ncbi:phage baseplate assembly protein [Thalassospira sp.]|uniref:phage baseplate assembly protein n=1 Tax=Thalassospira sp. TaxID=1912094 RepID=UPI003AA96412
MNDEKPEILLDGVIYNDWQKCAINLSIDDIADTFAVTATEFRPDHGDALKAVVRYGEETILTGHIETIDISTVPDQEGVRLSGRSNAGDLVDCSAIVSGGELRKLTLLEAARVLCKPFGIAVRALVDTGAAFDKIKVEQGESVSQVLDRICRERGFNAWSDGDGGIALGRPGWGRAQTSLRMRFTDGGQLRRDNNIIELSSTLTLSNRFDRLIMRSQAATSDTDFGLSAAQPEATARDDAVGRYRPKIITSDGAGTAADLQKRVDWEVARRVGKSTSVRYTVEGWRQVAGGDLWRPGLLVSVVDEPTNINSDMLITAVSLTLDEDKGGYRASLDLEPLAAWLPAPTISKAAGGAQYAALRRAARG